MRALVYNGPRDVAIDDIEEAQIERPIDVLVKITSINICGSDLHIYEGRAPLERGMAIGHENLGQVVGVGDAVVKVQVGDMVSLPFNIACGFCRNCEKGLTGFCLSVNPGMPGGAYGYLNMGGYQSGQAEFLRVPFEDFNYLRLPDDAREKEADYALLSDIWPTGWYGTELAGVMPGDSVVIFGGGKIGVVGIFVPEDPAGPDELMQEGKIVFDIGNFFAKGLGMASGQANVKALQPTAA